MPAGGRRVCTASTMTLLTAGRRKAAGTTSTTKNGGESKPPPSSIEFKYHFSDQRRACAAGRRYIAAARPGGEALLIGQPVSKAQGHSSAKSPVLAISAIDGAGSSDVPFGNLPGSASMGRQTM